MATQSNLSDELSTLSSQVDNLCAEYDFKAMSIDEVALARNALNEVIGKLEKINFSTGSEDHILLKWGTLKGWNLTSEKGKELLKSYGALGTTMGAMSQHDTPEQKELICQMIDECQGIIQSDWSGEYLTKKQAKDYIMEYES